MTRKTKALILLLAVLAILACGIKLPVTGDSVSTITPYLHQPYGSEPLAWTPVPTSTDLPSVNWAKPEIKLLSEEK